MIEKRYIVFLFLFLILIIFLFASTGSNKIWNLFEDASNRNKSNTNIL